MLRGTHHVSDFARHAWRIKTARDVATTRVFKNFLRWITLGSGGRGSTNSSDDVHRTGRKVGAERHAATPYNQRGVWRTNDDDRWRAPCAGQWERTDQTGHGLAWHGNPQPSPPPSPPLTPSLPSPHPPPSPSSQIRRARARLKLSSFF